MIITNNGVKICNLQHHFRNAHEAKGEDIRGETSLLELRRQYHCAAYNLMVAFISRTQTDVKFYTGFLFEEKEAKVSIIAFSFILNCCFDFMGDNYMPVWCL